MSVVAIDGPAGAGKTTIAKAVAAALGWEYVDTGAMYRTLTLKALRNGVDPGDEEALARLTGDADISFNGQRVFLDGEDVTGQIRSGRVTDTAPKVAAHPAVRRALVEQQRAIASARDVVMEGRDIGSVVVPDALLKIFLTASLEERAKRRLSETGGNGSGELEQMQNSIAARDAADSGRATSPLLRADDAVAIDTTGRDVESIVQEIVSLLEERRP
jgi:CMP/dCMP kinase